MFQKKKFLIFFMPYTGVLEMFSIMFFVVIIWAPSSDFVSSSIPSWQILTVHAQPFRGARVLAFCLKVPLDSLLVWASSWGSGETARMRRLAWTFAARIGDKYQICLTRSIWVYCHEVYIFLLWIVCWVMNKKQKQIFRQFIALIKAYLWLKYVQKSTNMAIKFDIKSCQLCLCY